MSLRRLAGLAHTLTLHHLIHHHLHHVHALLHHWMMLHHLAVHCHAALAVHRPHAAHQLHLGVHELAVLRHEIALRGLIRCRLDLGHQFTHRHHVFLHLLHRRRILRVRRRRYVVTGGTRANKAYVIDVATLKLLKSIPVGLAPEHLAFSPDGRYYYQGNPDGDSVSVIDMVSMTEIKRIEGFAEPLNITFTPDGSKAYVGNYGAHWVGWSTRGVTSC